MKRCFVFILPVILAFSCSEEELPERENSDTQSTSLQNDNY